MAKKVENRKVVISIEQFVPLKGLQDVETETTYFELIYGACKRPSDPQSGYTWDDIEKINRIKEYYEKSKDNSEINVEDADYEFIMSRIKTNKWNTIDKNLLDFKKYMENI